MKVLVDINVLLDVFQKREPHYQASAQVVAMIEEGLITRNTADFVDSPISAISPTEFLSQHFP